MARPFELRIQGLGEINGLSYKADGEGRGDDTLGEVSFGATFSQVPDGVDPFASILAVIIIPTVMFGREDDGARNLISLVDGEFQFRQTVVGDGVDAASVGDVRASNERGFVWTHRAVGRVELPPITDIDPFRAVMLPQGPGHITEVIAMPIVAGGSRRTLHAVRHFTFSPRVQLDREQVRDISVKPSVQGLRVSVEIATAVRPLTKLSEAELASLR